MSNSDSIKKIHKELQEIMTYVLKVREFLALVGETSGKRANLQSLSYNHQTVNYPKNVINQNTGTNTSTQTIKTVWSESKAEMLRKMYCTTLEFSSRHLIEI